LIGQDKYGNKYFENLEEELPRKMQKLRIWRHMSDYHSPNPLGRLQGQGVRSVSVLSSIETWSKANIVTALRSNPDGTLPIENRETQFWEDHKPDYLHRHAWMSYMVDKSPAVDKLLQREVRVWEPKEHRPTLTWTRSGYKPYNTYARKVPAYGNGVLTTSSVKPKYSPWTPVAKPRQ
jgi:NADH:ubiquinone oxidoreductase subunit